MIVLFTLMLIYILLSAFYLKQPKKIDTFYRKTIKSSHHISDLKATNYRFKAKPDWVKKEIIRLKAFMIHEGSRKVAHAFNRQFSVSKNMTVGKIFVANTIREHKYQIQVLHNKIKHQPPKSVPRQLIWGLDLTFKQSESKTMLPIMGVIEHHSRKNLILETLKDKTTINLLSYIFSAINKYGKPKIIRTDNEAIFTSKLFVLTLWLLGIKHQRTELHCPWQNGRIERFFGTLKQKMNQCSVESPEQLNQDLDIFRFWYNKVRTHNNLNGKTPDEVWYKTDINNRSTDDIHYLNEWEGLLTGFYHPP